MNVVKNRPLITTFTFFSLSLFAYLLWKGVKVPIVCKCLCVHQLTWMYRQQFALSAHPPTHLQRADQSSELRRFQSKFTQRRKIKRIGGKLFALLCWVRKLKTVFPHILCEKQLIYSTFYFRASPCNRELGHVDFSLTLKWTLAGSWGGSQSQSLAIMFYRRARKNKQHKDRRSLKPQLSVTYSVFSVLLVFTQITVGQKQTGQSCLR